ncbi:ecto-NOX disulfide-thiol exchanger 2 [Diaphorina citri]|uniref:Ecto-NOX disulfide-thiol exchanger 2 n=1 Tax=Diaphorina citri TaxID=121845 RepID=A0A3Q0IZY3_DIACI|nr:ecto-NOX disulfide-thiol exchanger 2 [Diaphorina citri]
MGGMMGPGVPQLMNTDFMNVFSKINTREPISFSDFILYPPSPNAPPPTTRDRPLGCKTIFVGGLPENFKESQLQELFAKCGEIQNVRLSTKRFAHIRFMSEMSVDIALYFSGYRVRIEDKTDAPNTGRLHIDFAQARDDQYEYECQQRALDRERRHMQRMQEEQFRVPSPLPVVHYSDHEAGILGDKLKNEETFQEALDVICTWLERGECNKRNANQFYTLLQSTNSHVRHLVSEKSNLDEEIQRAKDMYAVKIAALGTQYKTVEKVFLAASQKKAWDHFSKAQRKSIESWKKAAAKSNLDEEIQRAKDMYAVKIAALGTQYKTVEKVFLAASQKKAWDHFSKAQRKSIESWKKAAADIKILMPDEDNMDTESEDEDAAIKPKKIKGENKQALKDENDSLRCQLEAYKNEVEILKLDMQTDLEAKDKQLKVTQKTLENVQMNLMDAKREHTEAAMKTMALNKELVVLFGSPDFTNKDDESEDSKVAIPEVEVEEITLPTPPPPSSVPELDAKLIGLISIFLHIHPFGASVEYIWSYVSKFVPSCKSSDLEAMMSRYPSLFTQDLIGIGANIERRWKYLSLD